MVGQAGTRGAPYAAGQSWPAVWFTPLLHDDTVVEGIRANRAPQLLVCGGDDEHHDPDVADVLAAAPSVTAHTVSGVGHWLDADDAVRTARAHLDVARVVDTWLTDLPS